MVVSARFDLVFSSVLSELRHNILSTARDILVMKNVVRQYLEVYEDELQVFVLI